MPLIVQILEQLRTLPARGNVMDLTTDKGFKSTTCGRPMILRPIQN